MSYYNGDQLREMGAKFVGRSVQISTKCSIYGIENMSFGDFVRVDDFCMLSGRIDIGRNVHIAAFCNVAGGEPGITIGDFSGLAYAVTVFAQSDDYSGKSMTNPTIPDCYKREVKLPIIIEKHCIVGAHSIVLPGVRIADGCAIGAMSMVTKSTQEWGVYFGCPAKRLKSRSQELLSDCQQYLDLVTSDVL